MTLFAILFALTFAGVTLTHASRHCHHGNCSNLGEIQLDTGLDDDSISLTWKVNSTEFVYGYKVVIESDETSVYQSPILEKHTESMAVTVNMEDSDYRVCLVVLMNETEVIATKCEQLEVSKFLQMVVGILAGVVFLIPCLIALTYIIYKDRQILKTAENDQSEFKVLIKQTDNIEILGDVLTKHKSLFGGGKDNESFEGDSKTETGKAKNKTVPEITEASLAIEKEIDDSKINMEETHKDIHTGCKGNNVTQPEVDQEIATTQQTSSEDVEKETKEKETAVERLQETDMKEEGETDSVKEVDETPSAYNTKL